MTERVLVVIPTLNEELHIAKVLADLSADRLTDADVRFVVADGGSRDATVAIVQKLAAERQDLVLLHNPQRLQSAAINLAAAAYGDDRDLLVRCDAHADYPARFLERLIQARAESGADAIVVPMDSVGETCIQKAIAWVSDTKAGSGGSAHRGGSRSGFVDHGHHALFTLDSFRRAGGYDPDFSHNEDAELDCRQRAMGSKIYLDASIRLRYAPRSSLAKLARQYFQYGKGRSRTVRRHPHSLRARQFAIPLHVMLFACLLIAPVAPWAWIWPSIYAAILVATSLKITIARRSPCGLLAAPAAATMHFAWGIGFLWGLATIRERRWHATPSSQGTAS